MQREVSVSMRKGGGQKARGNERDGGVVGSVAGYRQSVVVVVIKQETRERQYRRGALCLARLPHASSQAI